MKRFALLFLGLLACVAPAMLNGQQAGSKTQGLIGLNYKIQPLDVIQITVFKEPDLDREVRVAQDGSVTLPLIGKVNIEGMTMHDATTLITELYDRDYLVNPQITLNLLSYTERRAYVHGQVNRPGPIIIPPEETMTLSQVVSAAGSRTRLASNTIRVTRTGKDGKKKVFELQFDEILEDPEAKDIVIIDGDSIFIPERII